LNPAEPIDTFVALGEQLYRIDRSWAHLPQGRVLDGVSQVAVDSHDHVYVFQRADPPVVVFDESGELVGSWGTGTIADAHGIFITKHDRVLLVDRDGHQVIGFDLGGRRLWEIGERRKPRLQAPFNHPADVAVDPESGHMYVADGYGNSAIHRFDGEGKYIRSWGRPGKGPSEFTTPHGVWVDASHRVLVADRENDRLQIFDPDGTYLDEWRDLYHPMDIFVDAAGNVFVTDQIPRITMFSPDGTLVGRCKPVPIGGHGICGDSRGNLYLSEVAPVNRVTKLVRLT
jgi:DNA-binding beta-propeller fold protein YncE